MLHFLYNSVNKIKFFDLIMILSKQYLLAFDFNNSIIYIKDIIACLVNHTKKSGMFVL